MLIGGLAGCGSVASKSGTDANTTGNGGSGVAGNDGTAGNTGTGGSPGTGGASGTGGTPGNDGGADSRDAGNNVILRGGIQALGPSLPGVAAGTIQLIRSSITVQGNRSCSTVGCVSGGIKP